MMSVSTQEKKIADLAVAAQQVQTLLESTGVQYSLNIWSGGNSISVSRRQDDEAGMPF